jgi:serine/threonine protein kinase
LGTLELIRAAEIKPIQTIRSDVPKELADILHRCLSLKPEDRYQNTAELHSALQEAAARELPIEQQAATLAALLVE